MVKELMSSLVNWLNRELVDTRIKVREKPPMQGSVDREVRVLLFLLLLSGEQISPNLATPPEPS